MTRRVFIYPYNSASASVDALKDALGIRRIRLEESTFRPSVRKTIINWGSSTLPVEFEVCRIINRPDDVRRVISKVAFFAHQQRVGAARLVDATTDMVTALGWYNDGATVVARCGNEFRAQDNHGGANILVLSPGDDESKYLWEQFSTGTAPNLFTRYIRRRIEYRCHFVKGQAEPFLVQRKRHRRGDTGVDRAIRSHDNGWLLTRNDTQVRDDVIVQSRAAFEASGLDFGAVDAIYDTTEQAGYVLEINSAPGLEGSSVQDYATIFRNMIPELAHAETANRAADQERRDIPSVEDAHAGGTPRTLEEWRTAALLPEAF